MSFREYCIHGTQLGEPCVRCKLEKQQQCLTDAKLQEKLEQLVRGSQSTRDAELEKLRAENAKLRAVAEAASELIVEYCQIGAENAKLRAVVEDFLSSFPKHYQGFPGKLEWPELHRLRQVVEGKT